MFLGCLEDVHPVQNVVGRCCVMEHAEYISCKVLIVHLLFYLIICIGLFSVSKLNKKLFKIILNVYNFKSIALGRPTEIEEKDVYICQSIYNEQRRQLTKMVNGLKRYTHSDTVTQDEIYFFRRLINPLKVIIYYGL